MRGKKPYPEYRTYEQLKISPSLLSQNFPRPTFRNDEHYYPLNELLQRHFASEDESRKFGAATFCGFLEDTIEVEHNLVIPAVACLSHLPYDIPLKAEQDLYQTATDEGFHAEQALQFVGDLRSHFALTRAEEYRIPLFLRRLEDQRSAEGKPFYRDLITVLNGVVTETRISVELSRFAANAFLCESVREVCRTHADDEKIHASQFRALGEWLWSEFDEPTRAAAAGFISASTVARSLPDVERMAYFFHQATGRSHVDSKKLVYSVYTADVLIEELLLAARPTILFIGTLGVDEYLPFSSAIEQERAKLHLQLAEMARELDV